MLGLIATAGLDLHASHLVDYGRKQGEVDEIRIELRAAPALEHLDRVIAMRGAAIPPGMRNGVERVRDRDDACFERNPAATQSARISLSVPAFMVRQDAVGQLGIERREGREHFRATRGVSGDLAALGARQALGLMDDVEQGLMDLSDIVKERDALDRALATIVESRGVGDDERAGCHAAHVHTGFRIVRLDRVEQCLERRGREPLDGLLAASRTEMVGDRTARDHAE